MLDRIGKKLGYKENGFTIIEVLIVLAVAGLIMAIVLVAVPQLQRNQRNAARRDVASRIVAEINSYAGNNNGSYPVASIASGATNFGTPATALGFFNRYLGCRSVAVPPGAPVGTQPTADCETNIRDPRSATPVGVTVAGAPMTTTIVAANGSPATEPGSIGYGTGLICSGETTVAGSNRNFVFMMRLEGGAVVCLDNA